MIRALAFLMLVTAAFAQPSLLDVRSATQAGQGSGATGAILTAGFDLKFTLRVPRIFGGPVVSAGAGLAATFDAPVTGAARRAVLARTMGAPFGVVKYNGDGGHFHVRHLVKGESRAQLAQVGQRVIDDWKAHYAASGVTGGDLPAEWGPDVIRNSYAADPTGKFAFAVRADGGVDPASAVDSTREVSEKDGWKTNAWPVFAKALGLLADSPFPARDPARVPALGSYPGADVSQSLKSILGAARAVVPAHAGRIPDIAFAPVPTTWTVAIRGDRLHLTATAAPVQLHKDARLLSYRREVTLDATTRAMRSDTVKVSLDIKGGRTEASVSWVQ
jgi:hypothetical protein